MNPIEFFLSFTICIEFQTIFNYSNSKTIFLNNIYIYCLKDLSISYKSKARFTTNRHFFGKPF